MKVDTEIHNWKKKCQWYCEKENIAKFFEYPCDGCDRTCPHLIKTSANRGISRELREKIYARDGRNCIECGKTNWKLTIDHLIPIDKGGTNDEWNLATMCEKCNSEKSNLIIDKFVRLAEKLKQTYA